MTPAEIERVGRERDARNAEAIRLIEAVERERRMVAYTSAGDPKLRGEMMMAAAQAGTLQRALALLAATATEGGHGK